MAALGLALVTVSSPATGHPVPPVPTAGFRYVFALTTGPGPAVPPSATQRALSQNSRPKQDYQQTWRKT
jgi:hypothetical protein